MDDALTLARALYSALEAGTHGPALRQLFHEDAYTLEHPNLLKPRGARVDAADMERAAQAGASLLARQHYDVQAAVEVGDMAILRLIWTGVIAAEIGSFRAGQVLTAHVAQFITVREGRIARIETYDCYEPVDGSC